MRLDILPVLIFGGALALGCGPAAESARPEPGGAAPASPGVAPHPDPYLWLEEIDSERALAWVRAHNEATHEALASTPLFDTLYANALSALNSSSRIPSVSVRGEWLYDFWRDEAHPRGLYRRTTLASLRGSAPEWQTVLDIDSLAAAEEIAWVFHGMRCLPPEHRHCLVALSPGGTDADEVREWDMATLSFVDDGFRLPVARSSVSWRDANSVYVGTDFGPRSMTTSGYPRIVKLWRRGEPLERATTLFEGDSTSVSTFGHRIRTDGGDLDLIGESTSFWETERYQIVDGVLHRLDLPASAEVEDGWMGRFVVSLTEDWVRGDDVYRAGSVLVIDPIALRGGGVIGPGRIDALFEPRGGEVLSSVSVTDRGILLTLLDDVRGRVWRYESTGGPWTRRAVRFPDNGAVEITSVDDESGDFFATFQSFTTPPTLYHVPAESLEPEVVARQEPTFDGAHFDVTQHWVTSSDGTRVPYFMVAPRDLALDGSNPTHIFAYGGFRNAVTPSYSGSYEALQGVYGRLWLERGGVFVVANIRGGGEFGPAWHAAALRENRPRAFEDFEAVAEDLIRRGVTSPDHLGIEGRSNGGLLVLATMTRRPDLYGAVIAGVPLSDMRRYHRLLAGASWMAEYGDPDVVTDWDFMRLYSPYQNITEGIDYPPVFFYGSTRDDRVHPAHARKTAARLEEYGNDVRLYENIEGGHGVSVTNEQLAYRIAVSYAHLWRELGRRP